MEFFAAFSTGQAWVELLVLIFLEMVLGIDNLVFIAITTNRLPLAKRHIGRRLGLLGALCMRILLLCTITWIVSHNDPLFTLPQVGTPITVRSLVLIVGGFYLVYKGISELRDKVALKEELSEAGHPEAVAPKRIGLPQAIVTIMVMDIVFSLDSVITAVGLVGSLPIMIVAVILAVLVMIVFADPISEFINEHADIKILALTFILLVGCILVCSGLSIEIPETTVYFAMFFALAVNLLQMLYARNLKRMLVQADQHRAQRSEREFLAAEALEMATHEDESLTETELRGMVAEVLGVPAGTGLGQSRDLPVSDAHPTKARSGKENGR
jgi:predicted tellurium resistance membrane protein TerC